MQQQALHGPRANALVNQAIEEESDCEHSLPSGSAVIGNISSDVSYSYVPVSSF